jgi:hypothetical protein
VRQSATYAWQSAYLLAIVETEEDQMPNRLHAAIAAIEQRRLASVSSDENLALADAEAGLQILISEAIAKYV